MIDYMTGATAAVGLLSCIMRARQTGIGCDVDASLFDVALHQLGYSAVWYLNENDVSRRQPRSAHAAIAPVQTFPTADGWIFVMCMTDKFWENLIGAIGREDLGLDPRFASQAQRRVHRDALTQVLDAELKQRTTQAWLETFSGLAAGGAGARNGPGARSGLRRRSGDGGKRAASGARRPAGAGQSPQNRRATTPAGGRARFGCRHRGGAGGTGDRDAPDTSAGMKLAGLRVIDLSSFLPGPFLTMALADHGAEVIKIEPPGEGDPGRHIGLADGPATVFFRNLNRGKKSVVLDLKAPEQRRGAARSFARRPTYSSRPSGRASPSGWALGQTWCGRKTRASFTVRSAPSARSGPMAPARRTILPLQAISGSQSITVGSDGQPAMTAIPIADQLSALHGLSAILMALVRRERTGRGDVIDIAMHDAMLAASANIVGPTLAEGRQPNPKHERNTGGAAFYQIYPTRDDRHLVLAGQEPKFIANLLGALGREDLIGLCLQGPGPHQRPVIAFLQDVFRQQTLAEAVAWLSDLDLCFGPVHTLPEAFEDRQRCRARHGADRRAGPPAHRSRDPLHGGAGAADPSGAGAGRAHARRSWGASGGGPSGSREPKEACGGGGVSGAAKGRGWNAKNTLRIVPGGCMSTGPWRGTSSSPAAWSHRSAKGWLQRLLGLFFRHAATRFG